MIDVGQLKHRMQLTSYSEIQDDTHKTMKSWPLISYVWAYIEAVKGLTQFDTKQIGEGVSHKITIRYRANVTSENWLYMKSRLFRIRHVRNLEERNILLELLCEEDFTLVDSFLVSQNRVGDPLKEPHG